MWAVVRVLAFDLVIPSLKISKYIINKIKKSGFIWKNDE